MKEVIYMDLGTIAYGECWDLQKDLFEKLTTAKLPREGRWAGRGQSAPGPTDARVAAEGAGPVKGDSLPSNHEAQYLLVCEHPPVYTLGKSGDEHNMLVGEEFLTSKGASFYRIDRGGDITFHGPGQLVGYPILDLESIGVSLRDYIHSIEQAVIDTVAGFGISGTRVPGAAGVWLVDEGPLRKICAIGVRASRFVTMHGFALNANTDLRWFDYINPCGFSDRGVTSISKEIGREVDMASLKKVFAAHFERILNIKINTEDYANRKTLGNQAAGRPAKSG